MRLRTIALATLLGAMAMTARAGVLTQDGVTFTSNWSGNVLTLEIDAANRSAAGAAPPAWRRWLSRKWARTAA